jgi:hypothetical protein
MKAIANAYPRIIKGSFEVLSEFTDWNMVFNALFRGGRAALNTRLVESHNVVTPFLIRRRQNCRTARKHCVAYREAATGTPRVL